MALTMRPFDQVRQRGFVDVLERDSVDLDLETRRLTNEKLRRELNPPKEEVSEHATAEYTLSPDEDVPTSPHL